MADNVVPEAVVSGAAFSFATDDITTVHYPIIKLAHGALDSATIVSTSSGLPVQQQGTWTVTGAGGSFPVTDSGGSLTVDNGGTFAVQVDGAALTSLQLIDDAIVADDAAFTPATTKVMMAGFEYDDTLPDALNEGDAGAARMSSNRNIYVQIRDNAGNERGLNVDASGFIGVTDGGGTLSIDDGAGNISIDDGGNSITVDNAALSVTGGGVEASALRVTIASDSTGVLSIDDNGGSLTVDGTVTANLAAGTNNIGDVDVLSVVPGTGATNLGKAEDAAHTTGDVGVMALAVRQDTAAALGGTDGDYQPLVSDASGRLHVNVGNTVTVASHAVTNAGTFAVQVDGNALTALQLIDDVVFADDAAFTLASSKVAMVGAIRDDALSALTAVEGDAVPLRVSSTGALHVTGGGGGTQYNIDDVASATATGTVALVVRKDSAASLAGTDGDVTGLQVDANGALRVTGGGGGTEYTVDVAAPAAPTGATFVMERDDALSALTEIEGDWTNPRASANGALWVSVDGTVTVGSHAVTNAGTFAVQVDGAALTALQLIDNLVLAEDAAHVSGDPGIQMLGIRDDTLSINSGAEGDYEPLHLTAAGRLYTSATIDAALPAGTNAIGKLAANSGVDIGDVDVLSIVPGTGATNLGKAEDSAHASTDTGVYVLAVRDDSLAAHSGTDGDYESLHTNADGALWSTLAPSATGGLDTFMASGSDGSSILVATAQAIKASAGVMYGYYAFNPEAATTFVHFYNTAAASVTVGTTSPKFTIQVPAGSAANLSIPQGINFSNAGWSCAATTTAGGNTAPATGVSLTVWYK